MSDRTVLVLSRLTLYDTTVDYTFCAPPTPTSGLQADGRARRGCTFPCSGSLGVLGWADWCVQG